MVFIPTHSWILNFHISFLFVPTIVVVEHGALVDIVGHIKHESLQVPAE
jgi:hypothetical protein